ncbi:MAG: hypothetical protein N2423_10285 [Novosphingobium sp.]|nr:hypothetical protein [Novosphingobium sp.]
MNDIERAISEISDIRSRLAASTRFRGYAPEAVAVIGLVSLGVMLAQMVWPDLLGASSSEIALVWGAVLVASGLTMHGEAISRSRQQHGGMARAMLGGALRTALPIAFVGAVVGASVLLFAPDVAWLLPGFWQMLVGVAVFASYATMPRGIVWPALWLLGSGGLVTMLAAGYGEITPLMAGGPFVPGYLVIAWLLHRVGNQDG